MRPVPGWFAPAAVVATTSIIAACGEPITSGELFEWIPTSDHAIWALGDSQAAHAGDPRRGPGWGERLGLGDGAAAMHGAGWMVPGPHSGETIVQRAHKIMSHDSAKAIVIMAGVNDLWTMTPSAMTAHVHGLDQHARHSGVDVVYVAVPPLPAQSPLLANDDKRRAFNSDLAEHYPDRLIDCEAHLSDDNGFLHPEFAMAPDDLHLNDAGEQTLADCIAQHPAFTALHDDDPFE